MDRILLQGLQFYAYHGVNPEEQALGQRFQVDLCLGLDLRPAGQTDDLARTVNYSAVYRRVRQVVEGERFRLLEALAERLAAVLLAEFPLATVTVRVTKLHPPLQGAVQGTVAVEITRERA